MPRLNISVPDELYERLEQIRDSLNVSAVCQEALRRELGRREPLAGDAEITDEIIERLSAEKEDYERESRERGFLVGTEWAQRAKFSQLRWWGEYKPASPESLGRIETPPYQAVNLIYELGEGVGEQRSVDHVLQSYPELKHLVIWHDPRDNIDFSFQFGDKRLFNEGFLQAVKRFWESVKDRL